MINDTTRIMRRWVEHPDYGIAEWLEGVPRNRPDGGEDDLPPTPTIYDDVDDPDEVRKLDPSASPALCLYVDSRARLNAEDKNYSVSESPLILAAAYTVRDMPEGVATLWGGYTARALRKCLRTFNDQNKSKGYRELNGIQVLRVGTVTEIAVAASLGQSHLWGFVLAELTVVDTLTN